MTEARKLTISYRELFFYLYFAIMFGMRMWGIYEGTSLYGPLLVIGFLVWFISVLMTEHTLLEYLITCALLLLAGIVYLKTEEKGLLLYFTLMLGMKEIEVKRLFKVGVAVGGTGMAVLTFLSSFGIIEDVAYLQTRPHVGTVFRHALGMPHPNTLSTSFVIISIMVMYLIGYEDKIKLWKSTVFMAIIAGYIYIYSGSRTGIVINIGFLLMNIIYAYRNKIGWLEKSALGLLLLFIYGVSVALPLAASDELVEKLMTIDPTLMSRIQKGKGYLSCNPLTFWGTRLVNYSDTNLNGIDLSQLYLLLNLGIISFITVTVLSILLIVYEIVNEKVQDLVVTFSLLLMGISDPFLYNISFKNLCFIFMGAMIYKYLEHFDISRLSSMNLKIQPLRIMSKDIAIRLPVRLAALRECITAIPWQKKRLIAIGTIVIMFAASIALYFTTPKPLYVLTDSNRKEHLVYTDLVGRTYTAQEIAKIKTEGNIVLNYTDENELMYLYYSDENKPIEGGLFSKNAAIIEKVRRSISVFFWGTITEYGIVVVMCSKKYIYRRKIIDRNSYE